MGRCPASHLFPTLRSNGSGGPRPLKPQPFDPEAEQVYTRPSGKVINRRWAVIVRKGEYSIAQINHYAVQSLESVTRTIPHGTRPRLPP
ncbi:MAG: hypothetical protein RIR62_595, partial [Pseudomonadota bacterium]